MMLRDRRGFTLAELLISLVMLSLVLAVLTGVMLTVQRGYVRQRETVRAEDALRIAESTLLTILRAGGANPRNLATPMIDPDPLNHGTFDNVRVVSDFNPPDGNVDGELEDVLLWTANDSLFVRWRKDGPAAAVAYPVRSLRFEYYANDGTLMTVPAQVVGATRAKVTLTSPRHNRPTFITRRDLWVYLRNRR